MTVDLLDRVDAMKDDVELLDVANDFVFRLLQMAHDEIERQRRQQQVNTSRLISLLSADYRLASISPSFNGLVKAYS